MKETIVEAEIKISIIICSYNGERVLGDCLNSLCAQEIDPDDYEILIVNNNSTDNTQGIAAAFADKYLFIRTFFEPRQGLSYARNKGLEMARGKYVAYIDDDARVGDNWLETAQNIIDTIAPDIFGGPVCPVSPGELPDWFKDSYAIRGDMGESGFINKGFICGSNIFFKKTLLDEYGGFNPKFGMTGNKIRYHEETHLIFRAFEEERKVYYSKELEVRDKVPDFKKHLLFFLSSWFYSGKDYIHLKDPSYGDISVEKLAEKIGNIFRAFETAVKRRKIEEYPFPENFIIENFKNEMFQLGQMVSYIENQKTKK